MAKMKRLYRSGNERVLGGVCGGIAEYFNIDPTIVRLLWILFIFAFGAGILLYLIAWLIMPRNPKQKW
jgi:phage shock protein PspC (stress-responsive transcriptional regulator)